MAAAIVFWGSLGVLLYLYVGFPLVVRLVARLRRRPIARAEILPTVSLILCAYNEERHIARKVRNCLELDYPPDRLEVIIVSDGSTDRTNALVGEVGDPRVRVRVLPERSGKTACQNLAVELARHEVLFFTDATTMYPPEALRLLVRSLHDPTVGCVTGKPVFRRDRGATSRGLGVRERYEMGLRGALGQVDSLLGAQDCIYAVRREVYTPIRPDLDSGFVGPLLILEKGYRTVYEPEALAFVDRAAPRMRDEFLRRSRITLRGMRGLIHMRRLMNPFRHGFVALSLISTRLLRWLSPAFLAALLASNLFLLGRPLYLAALVAQVGFYGAAAAGYLLERRGVRLISPLYLPLYFCVLACSATAGLAMLLRGKTGQMWETRR
jgi:cellulose synthase/poly-beta-1,6-N-acetylglucosamine synthase-like glycosyltransferase